MGSLSPVSRTEIESRRASTVDELVTGPTCVPCHPRADATAAEPNTRRKTKMARTTSASPCAPSAGAGTSRPPKNALIAMFAALRVADQRRRSLTSNDSGPAGPARETAMADSEVTEHAAARSLSLPWRAEAEALPGIEVSRRIASPRKTGRRGHLHLRLVLSPRWSRNYDGRSPTFNDN